MAAASLSFILPLSLSPSELLIFEDQGMEQRLHTDTHFLW